MAKEEIINQREILDYLKIKKVEAWRINNLPVFDKERNAYRKNQISKGIADILGIAQNSGLMLAIEVKSAERYKYVCKNYFRLLSRDFGPWNSDKEHLFGQVCFINRIISYGGLAGFASNIGHVDIILNGKFLENLPGKKINSY